MAELMTIDGEIYEVTRILTGESGLIITAVPFVGEPIEIVISNGFAMFLQSFCNAFLLTNQDD